MTFVSMSFGNEEIDRRCHGGGGVVDSQVGLRGREEERKGKNKSQPLGWCISPHSTPRLNVVKSGAARRTA